MKRPSGGVENWRGQLREHRSAAAAAAGVRCKGPFARSSEAFARSTEAGGGPDAAQS